MAAVQLFKAHNHTFEPLDITAATLDEATIKTGHGVYAVFRTYEGRRVLRLADQLERIRTSAALLGMPYHLRDDDLREAVRRALDASGPGLWRVRVTVPYAEPDSAIIALEPFTPPGPEIMECGVRVGLSTMRRENARAKDSRFIELRRQLQIDQGMYEVLLTGEDGCILEGTTSNFYAVRDGKLYTAANGVLHGIARRILLEIAPTILPVVYEPVCVADCPLLSEAMISSASRGPLPVVEIGGVTIGTGRPGPIFAALRAAYDARVEQELEPL